MVELSFSVKLLLVLTAALMSGTVGMVAGLLGRLDGDGLPACVARSGAVFGTTLTLLLLVLNSLGAWS
ncbi:hypothetical protein [Streptomyces luteireticuli]|uniref:Uncharacterized protein n=1 Tax=Streptomyces luteireticuli TaxID=173858 RepID=A0ABP3IZT2_9ACTN